MALFRAEEYQHRQQGLVSAIEIFSHVLWGGILARQKMHMVYLDTLVLFAMILLVLLVRHAYKLLTLSESR